MLPVSSRQFSAPHDRDGEGDAMQTRNYQFYAECGFTFCARSGL